MAIISFSEKILPSDRKDRKKDQRGNLLLEYSTSQDDFIMQSFLFVLSLLLVAPEALAFQQPHSSFVRKTHLFAGFGNKSAGMGMGKTAKKKGGEKKSTSNKKKIQLKEKILKEYGGDIAKGTEQRVQKAISELSPSMQQTLDLYKKVTKWDAYMDSIKDNVMQQANIPQRDIEGAKRAKAQLEAMLAENNIAENDLHNIFQKTTWDASADAKAMNAMIGKMPDHIEERVDKACSIIADVVKAKGRKDGKCLDVGCGHGSIIPNFTNAGIYPNQITGIDLSTEMIRNAKSMYRGVEFEATDFLQYNPEKKFDGIMFCSALHDLPDMKGSLVKAASLLNEGGKLVILHAQGAENVAGQHKANPVMVKRLLPETEELEELAKELELELDIKPAKAGSEQDKNEGYLAVLVRK